MATIAEVFALACRLHQERNYPQAEQLYRQVLQADPTHADAWFFLGRVCQLQNKLQDAELSFRQVVRLIPNHVSALNCLAIVMAQQGKLADAQACLDQAVHLQPEHVDVLHNLGSVLSMQGKSQAAIERYRQLLRLKPDHAEAHYNLGLALERTHNLDEAVTSYRRATALEPNHVFALNNLGNLLKQQGNLDDALRCFEQALEAQPGHAGTRYNRSLLRLLCGQWQQGWPDYEMRSTDSAFWLQTFPEPRWDGGPFSGKTLLIYGEQGLGDTMQFIRYVPLVKQHGGQVFVACQAALQPLLAGACGIDRLLVQDSKLPPFDIQVPLLSLPGVMKTVPSNVPAPTPYLDAKPELVNHWMRKLRQHTPRFLVGIAWQGKPSYLFDRQRSIPIARFAELAEIPRVRLVSLQKGPGTEQLQRMNPASISSFTLDVSTGAFMDTAAIMNSLDLVICSDSAIAHLAGALGVPVWLALPLIPDWRWQLDREDSPWYPTMRLFRQSRLGQWDDVFDRIAKELNTVVSDVGIHLAKNRRLV